MFEDLRQRVAEHGLELLITDEARQLVAREGFDPVYGARPLHRFIAHEVETRIARALLGTDARAGTVVRVDTDDGELSVSFVPPEVGHSDAPVGASESDPGTGDRATNRSVQ
jgi:ATP-dependent Clp protease ATP-binding subunit ClpB